MSFGGDCWMRERRRKGGWLTWIFVLLSDCCLKWYTLEIDMLMNPCESLKLPSVDSFSVICFLKIPLAQPCLLSHSPIPRISLPQTTPSCWQHAHARIFSYKHRKEKKKRPKQCSHSNTQTKHISEFTVVPVRFDSMSVISLSFALQINTHSGLLRHLFQSASICVSDKSTDWNG